MSGRAEHPRHKQRPSDQRGPAALRGAPLIEKVLAHLAGPRSPIGEPQPLSEAELRACEDAAGVALSPAMHAVLSFDAGWLAGEYGWFDEQRRLRARPVIEVIREFSAIFTEAFEPICKARFPGKAIALDEGSDSMRLLYFGDPDEHGEYPALFVDTDDLPTLGVEWPGFDVWIASALGIATTRGYGPALKITKKRILGSGRDWELGAHDDLDGMPAPEAGPSPGSVAHVKTVMTATPRETAKLTKRQLPKALAEHAAASNLTRLGELVADAKERGLPRQALGDALLAAAKHGRVAAMELLLAAGADPDARDGYQNTPLMYVIGWRHGPEGVRLLLKAGADPNATSCNGSGPLHTAVQIGSVPLAKLLLEAGAHPLREKQGR